MTKTSNGSPEAAPGAILDTTSEGNEVRSDSYEHEGMTVELYYYTPPPRSTTEQRQLAKEAGFWPIVRHPFERELDTYPTRREALQAICAAVEHLPPKQPTRTEEETMTTADRKTLAEIQTTLEHAAERLAPILDRQEAALEAMRPNDGQTHHPNATPGDVDRVDAVCAGLANTDTQLRSAAARLDAVTTAAR